MKFEEIYSEHYKVLAGTKSDEFESVIKSSLKPILQPDILLDPISVLAYAKHAQTILSLGKSIKNLLKKGNDEVILEWVESISADIQTIKLLLVDIVNILNELKVLIKEEWENYVGNTLIADISSIRPYLKLYTTFPKEYVGQINIKVVNIQEHSELAMSYGYGHVDSIVIGYRLQTDLLLLQAKANGIYNSVEGKNVISDTLCKVSDKYLAFFNESIDTSVKNSIRYNYVELNSRQKKLEGNYYQRTIKISEYRHELPRAGRLDYVFEMEVEGNLEKGFKFYNKFKQIGGRVNRRLGPANHQIMDIADNWKLRHNNAHKEFNINNSKLKVLEASIKNVESYISLIEDNKIIYSDISSS